MPIGIRPLIDFPFKKTFGSPENRLALISLLNAILAPRSPIVDVTILNPFNLKDFADDKLSVLDIKATDQEGTIYDLEMQLAGFHGLEKRMVFYAGELYTGQMLEADKYGALHPVCAIWLINGIFWPEPSKLHHVFRLADLESGRILKNTMEIHTLELGRYTLREADLAGASMLDCWLYWLLYAHEYELDELLRLFPSEAMQQASRCIARIAQLTEDKAMYDAREKARRDKKWEMDAARQEGELVGEAKGEAKGKLEGEIKGEIKMIRLLQGLLLVPVSTDEELRAMSLPELESLTSSLQEKLRNRQAM